MEGARLDTMTLGFVVSAGPCAVAQLHARRVRRVSLAANEATAWLSGEQNARQPTASRLASRRAFRRRRSSAVAGDLQMMFAIHDQPVDRESSNTLSRPVQREYSIDARSAGDREQRLRDVPRSARLIESSVPDASDEFEPPLVELTFDDESMDNMEQARSRVGGDLPQIRASVPVPELPHVNQGRLRSGESSLEHGYDGIQLDANTHAEVVLSDSELVEMSCAEAKTELTALGLALTQQSENIQVTWFARLDRVVKSTAFADAGVSHESLRLLRRCSAVSDRHCSAVQSYVDHFQFFPFWNAQVQRYAGEIELAAWISSLEQLAALRQIPSTSFCRAFQERFALDSSSLAPQQLKSLLHSAAELQLRPTLGVSFLQTCAACCVQLTPNFSPSHFIDVARAFACLDVQPGDAFWDSMFECLLKAEDDDLDVTTMSRLLWACGLLRRQPPAWFWTRWCDAASKISDTGTLPFLVEALYATIRLGLFETHGSSGAASRISRTFFTLFHDMLDEKQRLDERKWGFRFLVDSLLVAAHLTKQSQLDSELESESNINPRSSSKSGNLLEPFLQGWHNLCTDFFIRQETKQALDYEWTAELTARLWSALGLAGFRPRDDFFGKAIVRHTNRFRASFTVHEVSDVLIAHARLRIRSSDALYQHALGFFVNFDGDADQLPGTESNEEILSIGLTPASASDLLWAFAYSEVRPWPGLIGYIYRLFRSRPMDFGPTELSCILWSLGRLDVIVWEPFLEEWYAQFNRVVTAADAVPERQFSTDELSDLMYGFARLRVNPRKDFLSKWAKAIRRDLATQASTRVVANLMWSFSVLGIKPAEGFFKHWYKAAVRNRGLFSVSELTNTMYAFGRLTILPREEWMSLFFEAFSHGAARWTPYSLVTVFCALARLKIRPTADFMERWYSEYFRLEDEFTCVHLGESFWAFAVIEIMPRFDWVASFERQFDRMQQTASPPALVNAMYGFSVLGLFPSAAFVDVWYSIFEREQYFFSVRQILDARRGFERLDLVVRPVIDERAAFLLGLGNAPLSSPSMSPEREDSPAQEITSGPQRGEVKERNLSNEEKQNLQSTSLLLKYPAIKTEDRSERATDKSTTRSARNGDAVGSLERRRSTPSPSQPKSSRAREAFIERHYRRELAGLQTRVETVESLIRVPDSDPAHTVSADQDVPDLKDEDDLLLEEYDVDGSVQEEHQFPT
ncbi:Tbc2 translation factor, chloroplastic [Porphyridium purpureum]|uniref:Tbc2 translation factor, chloroplastic n=1 Tax=Porphyridium purpureum TaxID=35688 RepID=A0A5J4YW57_PORPP|nr:Tbc2 translation factor, chloroplastic [Porphyridium purpureum]|eukprot:POR2627..scf209_3